MKVIKFSAEWCKPCQAMKPLFEKAKEQYKSLEFIECDIEENPDLADKYNIRNLPTILIADGDMEVIRKSGTITFQNICSIIDSAILERKAA